MKKIIICAKADFPSNNATATYFYEISKAFDSDWEKYFFGYGKTKIDNIIDIDKNQKYCSLNKNNNFVNRILSHLLFSKRIFKKIKKCYFDIDIMLFDSSFSIRFLNKVEKFVHKTNKKCKFVLSVVEEFSKNQFVGNKILTYYVVRNNHDINNNFCNLKYDIIAISSYLEKKFAQRNFNVLRVPFIYDENTSDSIIKSSKNTSKINYIYAGIPGNKDLLAIALDSFQLLSINEKKNIHVDIFGVNKDWYICKSRFNSPDCSLFTFHGIKDKNFVLSTLKKADFTFLLRNEKSISSIAGFPTKISEALHYGVVPITNLTSDLGLYLVDGYNSIVSQSSSEDDFVKALKKSIEWFKNISELKLNAAKTSKEKLSVSFYKNIILNFLGYNDERNQ